MALDFEKAMKIFAEKRQEREKSRHREEIFVKKKVRNRTQKELLDLVKIIESKLDEQITKGNLGYYSDGDSVLSVFVTVKDRFGCDCEAGERLSKEIGEILSSLYINRGWSKVDVEWRYYSAEEGKVFIIVLW